MASRCSSRRPQLAQALGLEEPEHELILIYGPVTGEVWGWGYSEAMARAAALLRMEQLDGELAPRAGEETPEAFLGRCGVMRVRVAQSQVLELLWLLGVQGVGLGGGRH